MSFILLGILNSQAAGGGPVGVAGYFGGGINHSTVDKFAFPSDTRTTLGTGLTTASAGLSGMADSGVAGYFGGGDGSNNVDKFAFPSDTRSAVSGGLSRSMNFNAAMADGGV